MVPTYVAISLAPATVVAVIAPAATPLVIAIVVAGDVFPGLDVVVGVHHRMLHQVKAFIGSSVGFDVAVVVTNDLLAAAAATGFVAAAPHYVADYLGGSSEARP